MAEPHLAQLVHMALFLQGIFLFCVVFAWFARMRHGIRGACARHFFSGARGFQGSNRQVRTRTGAGGTHNHHRRDSCKHWERG